MSCRVNEEGNDDGDTGHADGDGHVGGTDDEKTANLFHLFAAQAAHFVEVRLLPCEELDDAHATEQLLDELGALVGPDHCLATVFEHFAHRL